MKVLIYLLISFVVCESFSFKCGHDMFLNRTFGNISIESGLPRTSNLMSNSAGMRFHVDYTSINKQKLVNNEYIEKLKQGIDDTVGLLSQLLKPTKTIPKIPFTKDNVQSCDKSLDLSPELAQGVDADMIIFPYVVTPQQIGQGVIAAAGACLYLNEYGKLERPIAGIVFLGSEYDFSKQNSDTYIKEILLHEITHILVFSPNLFNIYKTQPVYKSITWHESKKVILITPKVVEAAKKHFNCSTLQGVEVEDQGGSGSAGAHWESRIMLGDYMVSTDYDERAISEITMALFEDSGWYTVNKYTGGLFKFGKNEGCQFLEEKCITNEKATFPREFCDESRKSMCYPGLSTKGNCYLFTGIKNIPTEYQYWKDSTKGGFPPADYCPVASTMNQDTARYNIVMNCKRGKVYEENENYGEIIGNNSLCFESSLIKKGMSKEGTKAICYSVTCDMKNKLYTIQAGTSKATCDSNTKSVTFEGFDGEVTCASFSLVCTGSEFCNDIFGCVEVKSTPLAGNHISYSLYLLVLFLIFWV